MRKNAEKIDVDFRRTGTLKELLGSRGAANIQLFECCTSSYRSPDFVMSFDQQIELFSANSAPGYAFAYDT